MRPAFRLGVTGKLSFGGYDDAVSDPAQLSPVAADLRKKVWALLDWLRDLPESGKNEFLGPPLGPPLGLQHTPIVVLSSLAPGVDTLVAEAALDYAEEKQAEVCVQAPLPFPLEIYRRSSSFCPSGFEGTWAAKQARFDRLVARLRAQPAFVEARDLFAVELEVDVAGTGDPEADLSAVDAAGPRRRRRYRAAGEYVAAHSHLLLAIYDESAEPRTEPPDLYAAGTAAVVEVKRGGLSHRLLASSENLAWAGSGPVLRVPLDAGSDGAAPCARPPEPLDPYDVRREEFRLVVQYLEEFNSLPAVEKEKRAVEDLLELRGEDAKSADFAVVLGTEARSFADKLADVAAVRERASSNAKKTEERRSALLRRLAGLILAAAAFLGAYEHWLSACLTGVFRIGFLSLALAGVLVASRLYYRYRKSPAERQRFDHRAISEGLRVQFYWCLTGVPALAATAYLQRQRGELGWICQVLAATSLPGERWRAAFRKLSHRARAELFHAAWVAWVRGQMHYVQGRAKENEGKLHGWHRWSWSLAAAGVLNVAAKLLGETSSSMHHAFESHACAIGLVAAAGGGLLLVLPQVFPRTRGEPSPHRSFPVWIFARPAVWGRALFLGALAFTLPHGLAAAGTWSPSWHNWWLILTGLLFLGAALGLAWSERNFHGEHARSYRAQEKLYTVADRRLKALIQRCRTLDESDPDCARTLEEIQSVFHQLGREALAENAEWLILHRARPLEPFLAG